jgi:VanZ family protein
LHQILIMVKKNIFSILVALIIMYLSLTNSQTFDKVPFINIPNIDKVVHFGMYFGLMLVIILENRKNIKSSGHLFLLGLIPFSWGILMEILQSVLTITRTGSVYDALANGTGVFVSILLWLLIKPFNKRYSDTY